MSNTAYNEYNTNDPEISRIMRPRRKSLCKICCNTVGYISGYILVGGICANTALIFCIQDNCMIGNNTTNKNGTIIDFKTDHNIYMLWIIEGTASFALIILLVCRLSSICRG